MNTICINHTRKTDSIPLNDEFLTAFGKREKEYDELVGRSADIDKTSLDVIDVHDSDEDDGGGGVSNIVNKVNYSAVSTGKVRMIGMGCFLLFYYCGYCSMYFTVFHNTLILDTGQND